MIASLIAPCGMNCQLCIGHLRDKKKCDGCNGDGQAMSSHCVNCAIKNCVGITSNKSGLCYECVKFPCRRLKQLDSRYRLKYKMSMIDNLEYIREHGMDSFLLKETEKWTCKECGGVICVHRDSCIYCNSKR